MIRRKNRRYRLYESANYVNLSVMLLEDLFQKYNNLYFDGDLPNIKLSLNRRSNSFGTFRFKASSYPDMTTGRYEYKITDREISISKMFDYTLDGLSNTLIHEMIHYYDSIVNEMKFCRNTYDKHGEFFLYEAERINHESGLKISKYGIDQEDFHTASQASREATKRKNEKPMYLIFTDRGNNKRYMYTIENDKYLQVVLDQIVGYSKSNPGSFESIWYIPITRDEFDTSRYKFNRTAYRGCYYVKDSVTGIDWWEKFVNDPRRQNIQTY